MKKFCLCLLCLCLAFAMTACGNATAEEAAMAAVKADYQTALDLYCAVYGAGLPTADGYAVDPDGNAYTQYAPVADSVPYQSTAELRAAIETYFSAGFATQLCAIAFGDWSGSGTGSTAISARYRDVDGVLQVNMVHTARFAEKEAMIPDFATLDPVSSAYARVTLEVTLHPQDKSRSYKTEWILLLENDRWKFDTAPYVSVDAVEEID